MRRIFDVHHAEKREENKKFDRVLRKWAIKKAGRFRPTFFKLVHQGRLSGADFLSLQTLLAGDDLEGNLLAFGEGLEAIALDSAEVNEHVRTVLTGNEAEALGVVEPLYGADLTIRHRNTPIRFTNETSDLTKSLHYWCARKREERSDVADP
jgi:hypothetical protein